MITDDIKARIPLDVYVGRSVSLRKAGKSLKGLCPFHAEKTPSFTVDAIKGTWHCFGCDDGGDLFSFAMKKHNWTFKEALEELAKEAGIEIKRSPTRRSQEKHREKLLALLRDTAAAYHRLLEMKTGAAAREYLHQRGLTDETIQTFHLGYAPDEWTRISDYLRQLGYSDSQMVEAGVAVKREKGEGVYDLLRDRIVIPIRDPRGQTIALAGRTLANAEPKYLNGPTTVLFDKSRTLFALDREACRKEVVIVEGYMDAIQAHQAGYRNVVAQMGTAFTPQHLELLRNAETIFLALDGDKAGQVATWRSIATLVKFERDVRVVTLPDNTDPDDLIRQNPEGWVELQQTAEEIGDYIVRVGCRDVPDDAPLAKRWALAKQLIPMLVDCEKVPAMWNLQTLAQRLGLDTQALLESVNPFPSEPDIRLVEKNPPEPLPMLHMEIIAGFMRDPTFYYNAQRKLREWGLPVISPADFDERVRFMFLVFLEAINQYETEAAEYMEATLPQDAWQALDKAHTPSQMEMAIQMLRMFRLQREVQELVAAGEHDKAQDLIRQQMILRSV